MFFLSTSLSDVWNYVFLNIIWPICESKFFFNSLVFVLFWWTANPCLAFSFLFFLIELKFFTLLLFPFIFFFSLIRTVFHRLFSFASVPLSIFFFIRFEDVLFFSRQYVQREINWIRYTWRQVYTYVWRSRKPRRRRFFVLEIDDPDVLSSFFFKLRAPLKSLITPARMNVRDFRKTNTVEWFSYENDRINFLVTAYDERERLRKMNEILAFKREYGILWPAKGQSFRSRIRQEQIKIFDDAFLANKLANMQTLKRFWWWKDEHTLRALLVPAALFFLVQWYNENFFNWGAWVACFAIVWWMFWKDWIFSAEKWFAAFCIWSTIANIYLWLPFTG